MTVKSVLLVGLLFAMVAFAIWGMRPRKKVKPGRHNNWAQRDGTELLSGNSTVDREIGWVPSDHHGGLL